MNDDELPGMWEEADLIGGWTDIPVVVDPLAPPNRIYLIQPGSIHRVPLPEWEWTFEDDDDVSFVRGEE